MSEDVSFSELEQIRVKAAHIVSMHGEKYLPIFERIENEYNQRIKENNLLTKAKMLSIDNQVN